MHLGIIEILFVVLTWGAIGCALYLILLLDRRCDALYKHIEKLSIEVRFGWTNMGD
jgi:hypothetical protein